MIVFPHDPRAGEDIAIFVTQTTLRLPGPRFPGTLSFVTEPTRIIATPGSYTYSQSSFPVTSWVVGIARNVPAGLVPIPIRSEDGTVSSLFLGQIEVLPPEGASTTPQFHGLTGNWFNPQEGGWGVNLIESDTGPQLLALWLDYMVSPAPLSGPSWRVLSGGRWISPTTFRGVLYRTYDGTTVGGTSRAATVIPYGYMSLTFKSADEMEFVAEQFDPFYPTTHSFAKRATLRKQVF
ncbi:hypothetical protein BWI17_17095 [Betaproteobacteria bacterium GR16-43]|nr:hypothetical protein BWI17_17095 [Betaproteobacteria bacterium GR16-43]